MRGRPTFDRWLDNELKVLTRTMHTIVKDRRHRRGLVARNSKDPEFQEVIKTWRY